MVHLRSALFYAKNDRVMEMQRTYEALLPDQSYAKPQLKSFDDRSALCAALDALPMVWMPTERPASLSEQHWRQVRIQAIGLKRSMAAVRHAMGPRLSSKIGYLSSEYLGESVGCAALLFQAADHALLLLFPVFRFDGEAIRFITPDLRMDLPLGSIHIPKPYQGKEPLQLRAQGGPSGWSIVTTLVDTVSFALGAAGPQGMIGGAILMGGTHLLTSIVGASHSEPLNLPAIDQSIQDDLQKEVISAALHEISILNEQYIGCINAAVSESKGVYAGTSWYASYKKMYEDHNRLEQEPFNSTIRLANAIKALTSVEQPTSTQFDNYRLAVFGWALGASLCTRLWMDLHMFDMANISLGLESEIKQEHANPFELDENDKIDMLSAQTVWLDARLKPFLQEHCINVMDQYLLPGVDKWWKKRRAQLWCARKPMGNRIAAWYEYTFRDDGEPRVQAPARIEFIGQLDWLQPKLLGERECGISEIEIPPQLADRFAAFEKVASDNFKLKLYGPTYQNDDLWHAYLTWKDILAQIEDIKIIAKADIDDRVKVWRDRWMEAHKKQLPDNPYPRAAKFVLAQRGKA